jgi:cyclic-di-GMP-binding biofilm dispersal mediator protein
VTIDGARVLVIGASGGLGGRIARELSAGGAQLFLSGRGHEHLHEIARDLDAPWIRGDLRQPDFAAGLVDTAARRLGGLDAVVHAAGVVAFGPVDALEDGTLEELVDVNLLAPIRIVRAAATQVSEGGVIAMISAIVATMPTAGMAAYSAVKAGLSAFDVAAGRELRRRRIRLLDVQPPHTATGLEHRPIAGVAPPLPPGRDPGEIVGAIVAAIGDDAARTVSFDAVAAA